MYLRLSQREEFVCFDPKYIISEHENKDFRKNTAENNNLQNIQNWSGTEQNGVLAGIVSSPVSSADAYRKSSVVRVMIFEKKVQIIYSTYGPKIWWIEIVL